MRGQTVSKNGRECEHTCMLNRKPFWSRDGKFRVRVKGCGHCGDDQPCTLAGRESSVIGRTEILWEPN